MFPTFKLEIVKLFWAHPSSWVSSLGTDPPYICFNSAVFLFKILLLNCFLAKLSFLKLASYFLFMLVPIWILWPCGE